MTDPLIRETTTSELQVGPTVITRITRLCFCAHDLDEHNVIYDPEQQAWRLRQGRTFAGNIKPWIGRPLLDALREMAFYAKTPMDKWTVIEADTVR